MFDFKEEDERSESVRYLGKLGSRKKVDDDVALNKYRVLECGLLLFFFVLTFVCF